jgi:uncharacterized protein YprB with RNaseH-like and TPR domain
MNNNYWTKEEDKILAKHYPKIGTKVKMFLPNRTLDAIDHRVRRLGIKYEPLGEEPVGYLDIETSGLQGDFNYMLSWSIKTANIDEVKTGVIKPKEISDGTLDKRIVQEAIDTLQNYRTIYTFYGTKFDIAFLRTRALYHDIEFIPYGLIQHKDLYYLVKRILRIHNNRLESVADLLGIKGKTHLEPRIWVRANSGDKEALQYILEHNIADVILLEKVHKKLKDYEAKTRRYL